MARKIRWRGRARADRDAQICALVLLQPRDDIEIEPEPPYRVKRLAERQERRYSLEDVQQMSDAELQRLKELWVGDDPKVQKLYKETVRCFS